MNPRLKFSIIFAVVYAVFYAVVLLFSPTEAARSLPDKIINAVGFPLGGALMGYLIRRRWESRRK
jgi:hypothetical protein